ncbi:MAG: type I-U CRISPR-associated protein Cas7 [Deltaproteobacteria bacterium]|nr:type I-U CRISPR-associated protein Cas7 [Deltaproteobacteria bacterium]
MSSTPMPGVHKVFPPTYEGGKYATEERWIDGEKVPCVLLDSVQSQANRMELALLDAIEDGDLDLPRLVVEFNGPGLVKPLRVTSLEAPHRAADAIFRDSEIAGTKFRDTDLGKALDKADVRNAAPLFGLCPTALIFGIWDSTGPRGGLGAKFQRAIVSEMVGLYATQGCKPSSRLDPLGIEKRAGPIFRAKNNEDWTTDAASALEKTGKKVLFAKTKKGEDVLWDPKKDQDEGNPSKINHGNITPSLVDDKTKQPLPGGFTISRALQTTVLSLTALRRLRFPLDGGAKSHPKVDQAARLALAAIGLAGASLARAQGADLRSRCQLFPTGAFLWELLDDPTSKPRQLILAPKAATALASDAIQEACAAGLPWEGEASLTPSANLLELLRRSQQLAATSGEGE